MGWPLSDAATASTTSNLTACLVDERVGLAACDAARALFTPNDPGPGDAGGQRCYMAGVLGRL